MKLINCIRGGSAFPVYKKYDTFDSTLEIINEALSFKSIYYIPFVNTDFYNGYQGGILAEGEYGYICGIRQDKGTKCIFLFDKKYYDQVNSFNDVSYNMTVLPSLIPNPNHNKKMIISQVLIHSDGTEGGWSHGCQTIYPGYWDKFIELFKINEKGTYNLTRNPLWKPTEIYKIGLKNV